MLNNENKYTEKALAREAKITYDIPHCDRNDVKGAWVFSRTSGAPFNCHLSFSFAIDLSQPKSNIKHVRHVAHKLRMWYQTKSLPSNILWTRFVAKDSDIERVEILVHVPDVHLENFRTVVNGWNLGLTIEPATYDDDRLFDGRPCSIFDIMFSATSNETRAKQPFMPAEFSEPMIGPRFFYSVKLWVKARINHRAMTSLKTTDAIQVTPNKYLLGKDNTNYFYEGSKL